MKGQLTDKQGNPVAGATVSLSAYHRSTLFAGGGYYLLVEAHTDHSGNFSAAFNRDTIYDNMIIHIDADKYYPFDGNIFESDFQNKVLSLHTMLYKLATIKISFKMPIQ